MNRYRNGTNSGRVFAPEIQGEFKRRTSPRSIPWGSLSWLQVACRGMYQVMTAVFFLVSLDDRLAENGGFNPDGRATPFLTVANK